MLRRCDVNTAPFARFAGVLIATAWLSSIVCASNAQGGATFSAPRPHIVMVLVDDFGWANVGFHARGAPNEQEVQTPVLDALAAEGVILDRHYTFRFCSPSRSALQTGRNPIHVNVLNDEIGRRNLSEPVSGYSGIPRNMTGVAEKLASAGYVTIGAGKWHAGLATPQHTPHGRGYAHSLFYLDAANDYWTQQMVGSQGYCTENVTLTDLWLDSGPATGMNNSWACSQSNQAPGCVYEDDMFASFLVEQIAAATPSTPLFVFFAPHGVHAPLQVPADVLAKFAFINDTNRQHYAAMVNHVDTSIGRVVDALKAGGFWNDTLLVLSSDNGGPVYTNAGNNATLYGILDGAANNWPLRGGKLSNFEGGVRVNAFASGGFLPPARRGTVETGLIGIEDWYATFCEAAGVDPTDERAAAAGLPPIDSLSMLPLLTGANATSPRTEVILGSAFPYPGVVGGETIVQGLIEASGFKLLLGFQQMDFWQGPFYPNASWVYQLLVKDCGDPAFPVYNGSCLFNVLTDPTEHVDLSQTFPEVARRMAERISELQKTVFSPLRGTATAEACTVAEEVWGGFVGPFMDLPSE